MTILINNVKTKMKNRELILEKEQGSDLRGGSN